MVRSCWICKTATGKLQKSYFRIPKPIYHRNCNIAKLSALRELKWRRVLFLPYDTSGIRICSDHFVSGNPANLLDVNDPDWVPSQNLRASARKSLVKSNLSENDTAESKLNTHLQTVETVNEIGFVQCRFCTQIIKKHFCINIFQTQSREKFLKMVSAVLGHEVTPERKLSEYACKPCLKKITLCNTLLTFFRSNESRLMKRYSPSQEIYENGSVTSKEVENSFTLRGIENSTGPPHSQKKELIKNNKKVAYNKVYMQDTAETDVYPCSQSNFEVNEDIYDKVQIHSIIEDNSLSGDEVQEKDIPVELKKRKYGVRVNSVKSVEIRTLKCNICFKKFCDLDDLKMHKNFCKLFYCQLCKPQISFKNKREQICHRKKYHSQSVVCHICGNSYSQSYLLKHFRNHFENKRKCPYCNKMLKNVTLLMAHIDNFHGNGFSNLCDRCGGYFKNLKKHLVTCLQLDLQAT